MKTKRRLNITLETHETTVIRFRHSRTIIFCEACRADTRHFSVVQATHVWSLSETEICRLAGDKQIHSIETANGLMLCGNSLAAEIKG